ncbi:MAG TPA: DMT family transporter [Gaiellaceae bacterium]|nr:DMT family transporter [Gaiellaceae bacterium]
MIAVLLALTASVAWGFADFGAGIGSRRLRVPVVLAVSQTAGLVLVGTLVAASGRPLPSAAQLGWGAFAGAVGLVGVASFYRALAVGAMGIVGPISATSVVVPVTYGLVRGERPSLLQGVGVALSFAGVVGASLERTPELGTRRIGTGVGLALLAALGFGGSLLGLSRAAPGGVLWATLSMRAVAVPVVVAMALLVRPGRLRAGRGLALLVAVGCCDTGATILYGLATTRGLLSVDAVLASLYPVVLVVLARTLLAERIARPQLAGVGIALAGVALISAG